MNNLNNILSHHGILGMKWGVRRFQNRDGSLTPAGRRKAQKLKTEYKNLTGKKLKGKIPNEDPSKKPVRKLTDSELGDRIKRLENEKRALGLESDLSSNGKKFVKSIWKDVVAPAAINAGKNLLEKKLIDWGSEALGMNKKEVKSAYQQLKEEADIAKFKEEKMKSEKWMREEMERQQNKKTESKNNNREKTENRTSYESYDGFYNTGKKVYDAVWTEKTNNSSNIRKGQKLLNFYND